MFNNVKGSTTVGFQEVFVHVSVFMHIKSTINIKSVASAPKIKHKIQTGNYSHIDWSFNTKMEQQRAQFMLKESFACTVFYCEHRSKNSSIFNYDQWTRGQKCWFFIHKSNIIENASHLRGQKKKKKDLQIGASKHQSVLLGQICFFFLGKITFNAPLICALFTSI